MASSLTTELFVLVHGGIETCIRLNYPPAPAEVLALAWVKASGIDPPACSKRLPPKWWTPPSPMPTKSIACTALWYGSGTRVMPVFGRWLWPSSAMDIVGAINTYSGRGMAKPGLSRQDRESHAFFYMDNTTPFIHTKEGGLMIKKPHQFRKGSYRGVESQSHERWQ
jgi:hypothetical protein